MAPYPAKTLRARTCGALLIFPLYDQEPQLIYGPDELSFKLLFPLYAIQFPVSEIIPESYRCPRINLEAEFIVHIRCRGRTFRGGTVHSIGQASGTESDTEMLRRDYLLTIH